MGQRELIANFEFGIANFSSEKGETRGEDRGADCEFRISNCGFKSSVLDTGYSMLDKDLPFTADT